MSGDWFNIKMLSYQYRKSHCGDKTILRPSYLHNPILVRWHLYIESGPRWLPPALLLKTYEIRLVWYIMYDSTRSNIAWYPVPFISITWPSYGFSGAIIWRNSLCSNGPACRTYKFRYVTFDTLGPRQNGRHFADDICKCIFLKENISIAIKISLKFVPKGPINNIPALIQIMAWRRPGDKPLSEPLMVSLQTHICVTRPQWVKGVIVQPMLIHTISDNT